MDIHEFPIKIFENAQRGKPGCIFCSPIEGMLIQETKNFQILIDTFPVLPGHLMVSSLAHYGSAGEIPEQLRDELVFLKDVVKNAVRSLVGSCIFYEHGRAGCCMKTDRNGSKCEHFHLHCLPVDLTVTAELCKRFNCMKMQQYTDIMPLFEEYGNYLYFEESNGDMFFFPAEDSTVESHLMRTLVCQALGVPERSNWQDYATSSQFLTSYDLVTSFMRFDVEVEV